MINKFWIKEEQQNQQRNLGRFFVENAQSTHNNPRQFYAVISAFKTFLRPKNFDTVFDMVDTSATENYLFTYESK